MVTRFIFSKKSKLLVKKGQKRPKNYRKKSNTQLKTTKKEPNLSFDKAKLIKQFSSSQLKFT